jgi:hypothetical protein
MFVAATTVVTVLSCDASRATGPTSPQNEAPAQRIEADTAQLLGLFGPRPLFCPSSEAFTTSSVVGPLGGLLEIGGVSVSIPVGALLSDVNVILTVPASNNMEIDVTVEGTQSFLFELPITVTVSYQRCRLGLFSFFRPISAWHFDPETRELLERMPSIDNKLLRTVTFTTGHLSGYILAN